MVMLSLGIIPSINLCKLVKLENLVGKGGNLGAVLSAEVSVGESF